MLIRPPVFQRTFPTSIHLASSKHESSLRPMPHRVRSHIKRGRMQHTRRVLGRSDDNRDTRSWASVPDLRYQVRRDIGVGFQRQSLHGSRGLRHQRCRADGHRRAAVLQRDASRGCRHRQFLAGRLLCFSFPARSRRRRCHVCGPSAFRRRFIHYGANTNGRSMPEQFKADIAELISRVRAWVGDPAFPIILIADVYQSRLTPEELGRERSVCWRAACDCANRQQCHGHQCAASDRKHRLEPDQRSKRSVP